MFSFLVPASLRNDPLYGEYRSELGPVPPRFGLWTRFRDEKPWMDFETWINQRSAAQAPAPVAEAPMQWQSFYDSIRPTLSYGQSFASPATLPNSGLLSTFQNIGATPSAAPAGGLLGGGSAGSAQSSGGNY